MVEIIYLNENPVYPLCNLSGEKRWYGIPNLNKLLSSVSLEKIVVRESLYSGGFPDCQASALLRVVVNKIMPVF